VVHWRPNATGAQRPWSRTSAYRGIALQCETGVAGRWSPTYPTADSRRVLRCLQLFTPVSYNRYEHTIRFRRHSFTRIMSSPALPPLAHLKRLTTFIAAQDGSQTWKQLLPLMRGPLTPGRGLAPSEDDIVAIVRAVQQRVKHRHENQRRREAEAANAAVLQQQAVSLRPRARNTAPAQNSNAPASSRPRKAKKAETTAQTQTEERLVSALAELRERNVQYTEARKQAEAEERKAKRATRDEERKASKAKEAAEKAAKKAEAAKMRSDELELKTKLRDQRALQALEAKAQKLNWEKIEFEAAERAKRIDAKIEKVLDHEIEKFEPERGQKRPREEADEEEEENKENIEPEGEWQL